MVCIGMAYIDLAHVWFGLHSYGLYNRGLYASSAGTVFCAAVFFLCLLFFASSSLLLPGNLLALSVTHVGALLDHLFIDLFSFIDASGATIYKSICIYRCFWRIHWCQSITREDSLRMASMGMGNVGTAYIVMDDIVIAGIVMADIVMAYVVRPMCL